MRKIDKFEVAIIADGNESVGMAHIMRSSAIAEALEETGRRACFLVSDAVSAAKVAELGFCVYCLDSDYRLLANQAEGIIRELERIQADFTFFDSYFASNELFSIVSRQCPVGCFGYGKNYFRGMSLIVPYGVSSDANWYSECINSNEMTVLLGSKYVPLRKKFRNVLFRDICSNPERMLLTTGGTDSLQITSTLIRTIRNSGIDIAIDVVIGQFFDTSSVIIDNVNMHDIQLHMGLTDLSELMQLADVAISAGGFTLYELMASSVPVIAYAFADNQLGNSMLDGAVQWCGDIRENNGKIDQKVVEKIVVELKRLLSCKEERIKLVAEGRNLCDGHGAQRIAQEIIRIIECNKLSS